MNNKTEQQLQAADAAIERTVKRFLTEIEQMTVRWESVAATYVVERMLLRMCEGVTKLIDDPNLADIAGPASLKLSNALLDYRNSLSSER
jgi:hypothetical protein